MSCYYFSKYERFTLTRTFARLVALALVCALNGGVTSSGLAASPLSTSVRLPNARLESVSCARANRCMAVGWYQGRSHPRPLAEQWNGSRWTDLPVPDLSRPGRPATGLLQGVACLRADLCWAVGYFVSPPVADHALIEHWNGHAWSRALAPTQSQSDFAYLYGVACVNRLRCFAVGYDDHFSSGAAFQHALVDEWDGHRWLTVTTPNISRPYQSIVQLEAVSCTTAMCMAVGYAERPSQTAGKAVAETWTSRGWRLTQPRNLNLGGGRWNILDGVACRGSRWCTATGFAAGPKRYAALIEHWDGGGWRIQHAVNSSTPYTLLGTVSCPSHSFCATVGFDGALVTEADGRTRTFAEGWTGKEWVREATSATHKGYDQFDAVSCVAADACMAVGWSTNRQQDVLDGATLAEWWNGTNWSKTFLMRMGANWNT